MIQKVTFSIIIPVYNVEKYLKKCLDSISRQTFSDFEVICINDGSTDDSLDILEEYAQKDKRFKIFTQKNKGQGISRNLAIDKASGKYIVFVDPDDWLELNALEIMNNKFKETNADIIQFDYRMYVDVSRKTHKREFFKYIKKHFKLTIKDNEIFNWRKIKNNNLINIPLAAWCKAYNCEFIKHNNIKFAPNKCAEDHIFSISSFLQANKILYLKKIFYNYRNRLGSSVNKASDENFSIFYNVKLLKDFLINKNLYEEYKNDFSEYMTEVLNWHFLNIPFCSIESYLDKCRNILTPEEYEIFIKKQKDSSSFFEKIFSLKNRKINGKKIKYLTILGIKIQLPCKINGAI